MFTALCFAGLDALASAIAAGEGLQQRVRAALQQRSSLEELQGLAEEGRQLHVYVSDVDTLHTLLGKAQDWQRKAEAVVTQVRAHQEGTGRSVVGPARHLLRAC